MVMHHPKLRPFLKKVDAADKKSKITTIMTIFFHPPHIQIFFVPHPFSKHQSDIFSFQTFLWVSGIILLSVRLNYIFNNNDETNEQENKANKITKFFFSFFLALRFVITSYSQYRPILWIILWFSSKLALLPLIYFNLIDGGSKRDISMDRLQIMLWSLLDH